MDSSIIRALDTLLTSRRCLRSPEDLTCYSYDLFTRAMPELVVLPETTEEVSRILSLAHMHKIPVTPRGAGTSLTGGPVPVKGGIVMAMTRMNKVLEISVEDRLAVVQAGVITGDLQQAATDHRLFYPPNPTSADYCTIGGNVATNAGGASGVKYGVTKDYLQAMTAVLADGQIIETGSRCIKSVTGFDFKSAFCGSEGLLCVITEITLRLIPKPLAVKTSLTFFKSVSHAAKTVFDIISTGLIPSTMELMDDGFLNAVSSIYGLDFPPASGAALLIEFDGYPDSITQQQDSVQSIALNHHALEFSLADSDEERETLWKARRGGTAALVRNAKFMQTLDFSVPLSQLNTGIRGIQDIAQKHSLTMVLIGHAGDGNLHPMFIYDPDDSRQKQTFLTAEKEMCRFILSINGTLSGEHGIGIEKDQFLAQELSAGEIELGKKLKTLVDPHSILNPGKCGF